MQAIRFALRNFVEIAVGSLMTLMSLATLANVVGRYGFSSPIPWAEEFARYAFIWIVFFGAAACAKHKRHIVIDVLVMFLPKRMQSLFHLVVDVAVLGLMAVIIYYGLILMASATQPTATLGVPRSLVYAVVPMSAALVFLYALRDLYHDFRTMREGELP